MKFENSEIKIRHANLSDLSRLTEINNHYILNTNATFDIALQKAEQRKSWFEKYKLQGPYHNCLLLNKTERWWAVLIPSDTVTVALLEPMRLNSVRHVARLTIAVYDGYQSQKNFSALPFFYAN